MGDGQTQDAAHRDQCPEVRIVPVERACEVLDPFVQELPHRLRSLRDGEHRRHQRPRLRRQLAEADSEHVQEVLGRNTTSLRSVFNAVPVHGAISRSAVPARAGLPSRTAERAINALIDATALSDDSAGLQRASVAGGGADIAVAAASSRADEREAIEQSRIDVMRQLAETLGCRRQFLLGYFGDELPAPCGDCDTCASDTAYQHGVHAADGSNDTSGPPDAKVMHVKWGQGVVMSTEDGRVTVFFDDAGDRTLSLTDIGAHHLLTRT